MNAAEMHIWFRQYAQQMGMQNTRAILPEQIDNLINTSTIDVVDELVNNNVGTTNDRIITDNAKLASINALRTLYKVKVYNFEGSNTINSFRTNPLTLNSNDILTNESALYFVDFAIKYDNNGNDTRWFPIRIIDDAYLADVLNDWVLSPRMRTPVMVVYANNNNIQNSTFEIYLGENDSAELASLANVLTVKSIRISYIKKPNEVRYLADVSGANVDSDLPVQLQIPMLKHAVDLYRVSVQGSLFTAQQQNQNQQRENVRNNVRPDNDGYQN